MKVIEIFKSIDGEGLTTGKPVLFIRLAGCNLRCSYCDTKYSYENPEYTEMSVDDIVYEATKSGLGRVTITGGEPLIHKDCAELVDKLSYHDIKVNIETNGAVDVKDFNDRLSQAYNVLYTIDFKSISSGMTHRMLYKNIETASKLNAVIKFVVGSMEDLEQARNIIEHFKPKCRVYISPVFGEIEPREIVEYVLHYPSLYNCTVQVQLHKIIWEPDKRGV